MKKVQLTILLSVLTIFSFAQRNFTPEHFFGVKGGANYSLTDFKPSVGETQVLSYQGGLAYKYIGQPYVGIQLELNYSAEGWSEDLELLEEGSSYSRQLNYLELPMMTHIYYGNKNRVYLNLGPNFRYLLSEKESIDLSNDLYREYYEDKAENNFDFGIVVGLGLSRAFKFGTLAFEYRYYIGLTNIYLPNNEPFKESKNRNMSFTLSYYFLD